MRSEPLIIFTKEEVLDLDIITLKNYAWSWLQALGYDNNSLRWLRVATVEELQSFCCLRSPAQAKESCPHFIEVRAEKRPANALNVEVGQPAHRCTLKTPWNGQIDALRWLYSGGSPLVLGCCDAKCPAINQANAK